MRFFFLTFICLLLSCSEQKLRTFKLTKNVVAETSKLYPVGIRLKYPDTYVDNPPINDNGERMLYVWLNKKVNHFHIFTIAEMSQTKNGWPINDFFEDSAQGFIEKYQTAKIVGRTTFNTAKYSIPFLHIGLELDNHNEGHSWGVIELDSMQLQIQITEYLDNVNSTDNFLEEDIQTILETLEFEE